MTLVNPHGGGSLRPLLLEGEALIAELARASSLPKVKVGSREKGDIVMMGQGGFTPLDGFMSHADWQGVCDGMKMASGLLWPIPITLSTDKATPDGIKVAGDAIALQRKEFDAITSISVFTHLTEKSQAEFLAELRRICPSEGVLFLTVHGARALERAINEVSIQEMIAVDRVLFEKARRLFARGEHAFVLQHGHLTASANTLRRWLSRALGWCVTNLPFQYGITFIPETYIFEHWTQWFEVLDYRRGAIHDFQDIVVLRPRR